MQIDPELERRQTPLIASCKGLLYLCSLDCKESGLEFKHYFVTDGTWTIEFQSNGVCVHSNPYPRPFQNEGQFEKTNEVEKRMLKVCGATAHSVTLRNREHLARYISSGSWVSLQMLPKATLRSFFTNALMEEHLAVSNLNCADRTSFRYPEKQLQHHHFTPKMNIRAIRASCSIVDHHHHSKK